MYLSSPKETIYTAPQQSLKCNIEGKRAGINTIVEQQQRAGGAGEGGSTGDLLHLWDHPIIKEWLQTCIAATAPPRYGHLGSPCHHHHLQDRHQDHHNRQDRHQDITFGISFLTLPVPVILQRTHWGRRPNSRSGTKLWSSIRRPVILQSFLIRAGWWKTCCFAIKSESLQVVGDPLPGWQVTKGWDC